MRCSPAQDCRQHAVVASEVLLHDDGGRKLRRQITQDGRKRVQPRRTPAQPPARLPDDARRESFLRCPPADNSSCSPNGLRRTGYPPCGQLEVSGRSVAGAGVLAGVGPGIRGLNRVLNCGLNFALCAVRGVRHAACAGFRSMRRAQTFAMRRAQRSEDGGWVEDCVCQRRRRQ